jgi:excisionase family DNA binding protein
MDLPTLLTVPDAAEHLAISKRKLWELLAGGFPSVRIGRSVRIDPRDLSTWIDAQRSVPRIMA